MKCRMSFDETAYLLAAGGILRYPFFDMEKRVIGPEKAVRLVWDMSRKNWIQIREGQYFLQEEIREMMENIAFADQTIRIRSPYSGRPDLLCSKRRNCLTVLEHETCREESVLLSVHTVRSLLQMLEEEGYLEGIRPVLAEEEELADRILLENGPNLYNLENKETENVYFTAERYPETRGKDRLSVRKYGAYPYILTERGLSLERIPYTDKSLMDSLAAWMEEGNDSGGY